MKSGGNGNGKSALTQQHLCLLQHQGNKVFHGRLRKMENGEEEIEREKWRGKNRKREREMEKKIKERKKIRTFVITFQVCP